MVYFLSEVNLVTLKDLVFLILLQRYLLSFLKIDCVSILFFPSLKLYSHRESYASASTLFLSVS